MFYPNYVRFTNLFITFALKLKLFDNMAQLNRIKLVLVEQGKTGKWLAEALGKSACTVSKWCSNTAQQDLKTLAKIAQSLNVKVADLIKEPVE